MKLIKLPIGTSLEKVCDQKIRNKELIKSQNKRVEQIFLQNENDN